MNPSNDPLALSSWPWTSPLVASDTPDGGTNAPQSWTLLLLWVEYPTCVSAVAASVAVWGPLAVEAGAGRATRNASAAAARSTARDRGFLIANLLRPRGRCYAGPPAVPTKRSGIPRQGDGRVPFVPVRELHESGARA